MAKKIKEKPDSNTIAGRIAWYLEKIWRGSMAAMGKDLDIHPSSIGNVIHGRRVPGREILTSIGAHPLVNSEWLMHGVGQPIRSDQSEAAEIGLPIAACLFAGPPIQNPNSLEDFLYPVSRKLYRPSRYWMKVTENHPFARTDGLKISCGDMVLFESDREGWPGDLTGKPCLVAVSESGAENLCLGRSSTSVVRSANDIDLYDSPHLRTDDNIEYHKNLTSVDLGKEPSNKSVKLVAVGIYRCGPC